MSESNLPVASVDAKPRWTWAWILPIAAILAVAFLVHQARSERGPLLTISADRGYGIRPGDDLRYRGIQVGEVEVVELSSDYGEVRLSVRLKSRAASLAREGTRFWIVRPHLSLDEVAGLETIVGARYLELLPGPPRAERQLEFVALEEPPVLRYFNPGGLEITLRAPSRYGLQTGAPISYRQLSIGRVLSVGLSSDASTVEIRAWIEPPYAPLVRDNTRFWKASGVSFKAGLWGGLSIELESLRAFVVGAVAMATPDEPGLPAVTGHAFPLYNEPEAEWLEWRPSLPVGTALLPPGTPRARPLRSSLSYTSETFFVKRDRELNGWLLPLENGLLGPVNLLKPEREEGQENFNLRLGGRLIPLGEELTWSVGGIGVLPHLPKEVVPWPVEWLRSPGEPEDCVVIGDSAMQPVALSTARLVQTATGWSVDRALSFESAWNGAPVFAREDGRLVGVLISDGAEVEVRPLPPESISR